MRLLHAGPDHVRDRLRRGRSCANGKRHSRIYERQSLPLRRLSQYCYRHPAGSDQNGRLVMRPFRFERANDAAEAVAAAPPATPTPNVPPTEAAAQFLAGGTTIVDLMKLDVMRPERLIDI